MKQNLNELKEVQFNLPTSVRLMKTKQEADAIYQLCKESYKSVYPKHKLYRDDPYDKQAYILYTKNKQNEVVSTLRLIVDSFLGIPAEKYFMSEVNTYRKNSNKIMEFGRFVSNEGCIDLIKTYYKTAYQIAKAEGVNVIMIVVKDKDIAMHCNLLGAILLADELHINNGGKYKMACVAWELDQTKKRFFSWAGFTQEKEVCK